MIDPDRARADVAAAVLDVLGSGPLARDEIAATLTEDYGTCSPVEIGRALRELVIDGRIRRADDTYSVVADQVVAAQGEDDEPAFADRWVL